MSTPEQETGAEWLVGQWNEMARRGLIDPAGLFGEITDQQSETALRVGFADGSAVVVGEPSGLAAVLTDDEKRSLVFDLVAALDPSGGLTEYLGVYGEGEEDGRSPLDPPDAW